MACCLRPHHITCSHTKLRIVLSSETPLATRELYDYMALAKRRTAGTSSKSVKVPQKALETALTSTLLQNTHQLIPLFHAPLGQEVGL